MHIVPGGRTGCGPRPFALTSRGAKFDPADLVIVDDGHDELRWEPSPAERLDALSNRCADLCAMAQVRILAGARQAGDLRERAETAQASIVHAQAALAGEDADELGLLLDLAEDRLRSLQDLIAHVPAPRATQTAEVPHSSYRDMVARALTIVQQQPPTPRRKLAMRQLRRSVVFKPVRALLYTTRRATGTRPRERRPTRRSGGVRASPGPAGSSSGGLDDPPDGAGELGQIARQAAAELR